MYIPGKYYTEAAVQLFHIGNTKISVMFRLGVLGKYLCFFISSLIQLNPTIYTSTTIIMTLATRHLRSSKCQNVYNNDSNEFLSGAYCGLFKINCSQCHCKWLVCPTHDFVGLVCVIVTLKSMYAFVIKIQSIVSI